MIKWFRLPIIIIILSISLVNKVNANNLFVADNRFTHAARAADYSQCDSLWAIYPITKISVFALTNISCLSAFGGPCPMLAKTTSVIAAFAALYGLYEAYSKWAENIRKNTKVVNTIDMDKPRCGDTNNINSASNFVFDPYQTYRGWDKTGPLSNYCYTPEFDHTLKKNLYSKTDIYNGGEGKIGISYKGNKPVWIAPEDCKAVATNSFEQTFSPIGIERQFCAWTEGDEICAEGVFCTGLILGDIMPIYGFVGDPVRRSNQAKRKCGRDPYIGKKTEKVKNEKTGKEEKIEIATVDDFIQNKRCECYCCNGSDSGNPVYDGCGSFGGKKTCKTYNERYNAHCIKKPPPDEIFESPIIAPRTMSFHCKLAVKSGYTDFSFVGKAVRCVTKTIENLYFGREDVPLYNSSGKPILDINTGSPRFKNQCIDGKQDSDGECTHAFYRTMQENFAMVVSLILTLWMALLGIKFILGAGMSVAELTKAMLQLGVVLYFVSGTGWRDGYYKFLMAAGYELSADYFKATLANSNADTLGNILPQDKKFKKLTEFDNKDFASCQFSDSVVATDSAWNKMQQCNFFEGMDPSGNKYPQGDGYYAVLDSLDCRFSKYIGFDLNSYFPEIIKIATAAIFSSPVGFLFFITAIAFLVVSVILLLRLTFMLVSIAIIISFLIFISPCIIPLMLFPKTKQIFDKWLAHLLGYSLQPFVILALIALFILLIDGFFAVYLNPIYGLSAVEYREAGLGVMTPVVGSDSYDPDTLVPNMIKFLFLLVVMVSIFNKFSAILQQLTGVGGIEQYLSPPDFKKGLSYAAGKVGGALGAAGSYAASKTRKSLNEDSDAKKRGDEAGDKAKDDKINKDNDKEIPREGDEAKANNGDNKESGNGDANFDYPSKSEDEENSNNDEDFDVAEEYSEGEETVSDKMQKGRSQDNESKSESERLRSDGDMDEPDEPTDDDFKK